MSLTEEPIPLGLRDAGELLTVQRAAFVTEAQLHNDLGLPPLTQTLAELVVHSSQLESVADIGFVIWVVVWVREFLRGAVRLHILHHAAQDGVHGAWLTTELARHGYDISPGTLYPTLHRLEADGLLTSEQQVVDGRVRRIYHATRAGRKALDADRKALAELAREVLGDHTA